MNRTTDLAKAAAVSMARIVSPGLLWRYRMRSLAYAAHEPELRLLPSVCDKTKTSVDIGAADGIYSVHLLPVSRDCVAFEPQPAQAADLAAMFKATGAPVRVERVALSDHSGTATLRILVKDLGRSTIENDNRLDDEDGSARSEFQVAMRSLDDYGLSQVGFIKIDVEGHELAVLRGARATIEREKPSILVETEERHRPNAVAQVTAFLSDLGYAGYFLMSGRLYYIAEFDKNQHQNSANIGGWKSGWERRGVYVNNFFFLPSGREKPLFEAVRSMAIRT